MTARTLTVGAAALLLTACGGGAAAPTATPSTSASASISLPSTAAQPSVSQAAASPSPPAPPTPPTPLVSVAPVTPASPPPANPPAPVVPVPATGGTALQPNVTITTADEGKTFNVKVGAVIDVDLKADSGMQPWAVQNPDPAVLQAIPNPAAAAAQGVTLRSFKAVGAGTAPIMATDRPQCSPGQACPQFIRAWKVTIVVAP